MLKKVSKVKIFIALGLIVIILLISFAGCPNKLKFEQELVFKKYHREVFEYVFPRFYNTEEENSALIKEYFVEGDYEYCYEVVGGKPDSNGQLVIPAWHKDLPVVSISGGMTIGSGAFDQNKNLKRLFIPKTVIFIWQGAFTECKNLTSLEFAEDSRLFNIYDGAFAGCGIENLVLPSKLYRIYRGAFANNENLKSVLISGLGSRIDDYSFSGCINLENLVFFSTFPWLIGDGAFRDCVKLRHIEQGDISGMAQFGSGVFSGCTNLESFIVPADTRLLGESMFSGWKRHQTIYVQGRSEAGELWTQGWSNNCEATIIWNYKGE